MFESLKRKMVLSESKKISEDALSMICEDMLFDEEMEDLVLDSGLTSESEDIEDAIIEKAIDELPEDDMGDEIEDEVIEEQLTFVESFVDDENVPFQKEEDDDDEDDDDDEEDDDDEVCEFVDMDIDLL